MDFFKVITSNLILLTNVDIPVIKLDSVQNKKRLPNIIRWCLEDAFFHPYCPFWVVSVVIGSIWYSFSILWLLG